MVFTDRLELPGVVPYPDDGSEATDQRLPSPVRQVPRPANTDFKRNRESAGRNVVEKEKSNLILRVK